MNNTDKYTSLKLSKKLYEGKCRIKSKYYYYKEEISSLDRYDQLFCPPHRATKSQPFAYDIMWDIAIVHAKAFFGEGVFDDEYEETKPGVYTRVKNPTEQILYWMQEGKKSDAELYIMKHSIFFNKDRG